MSPKRARPGAPPPVWDEYDLRFANSEAVIDPVGRTVWITYAGTGHPKATD